jgi:hypothetical protein
MADTTSVTIETRHTRRVISFALWRIMAVDVIGERELSEGVYDRAWREIQTVYVDGEPGEAEFRLLRIGVLRAAIRAVAAAAQDGQQTELPVSPHELADALRDCVRAIDQNDDLFLTLTEVERNDVVQSRSAAIGLLEALGNRPASGPLPAADVRRQIVMPEFSGPVNVTRTERRAQPERSNAYVAVGADLEDRAG